MYEEWQGMWLDRQVGKTLKCNAQEFELDGRQQEITGVSSSEVTQSCSERQFCWLHGE